MSDIQQALETIFSADSQLYQARGFQRRIGFGERPALIHIDLANAWTRPGNAFSCDGMDTIIPGVQRLNAAGRAKGIPIVYTTTAYAVTDGPEQRHGPLAPQDPGRGPAARHRRRGDRRAHRPRAGRARDRQEARERVLRDASREHAPRRRRRHGDHHRRHDGRLRPPHDRGRDRLRLPPDRRPRVRRRPGRRASSSGTCSTSTRSSATSSRSRRSSTTWRASSRRARQPQPRPCSLVAREAEP